MSGEINNFLLVWSTVILSLSYCHTAAKLLPSTPSTRLAAFLPINLLLLLLPLRLTSVHLGGSTSFFISWLANFKLLLFAFNQGPLSSHPPLPLSRFIPLACFPIKFQNPKIKIPPKNPQLNYLAKLIIFISLIRIYDYKSHLHPHIILFLYSLHIYFMLETILGLVAAASRTLTGVDIEQQFNEPYLTTSLQDFWGRRWNLMVSNILHPTVYKPVRSLSARLLPGNWAPVPAVVAVFLVSGLMHELVFYNFGRVKPTGEVTGFFVLHGVSLAIELAVKKRWRFGEVPKIVSGPLVLVYVIYSSIWLFFPPFLRAKADVNGCNETMAFLEFLKTGRLVDPGTMSCPYF